VSLLSSRPAVLFDLDGTLTDPRAGIVASLRHAFQSLGRPCPSDDELSSWIGPPLHRAFARHFGSDDVALVERAVAAYRERYAVLGLFENQLYPGTREALVELGRLGLRLFVATSKPTVFAERILEHFELTRCFEAVHGSELSGARADKAELIAYVLHAHQLAAARTTMVGDREHDVLGARRCGVRAFGVLWGYGRAEELLAAGAARLFEA